MALLWPALAPAPRTLATYASSLDVHSPEIQRLYRAQARSLSPRPRYAAFMKLNLARLAPLLLMLSCAPALAQPRILESTGQRQPATSADTLFAARVTKAAGLPLASACRLEQPQGANTGLAGRELSGEGERVLLEGLSVERLRFETAEQAKVAAGLLGALAKIDARAPKYLTHAWGPKADAKLLEKIEALAEGTKLPADLAQTLGLSERARKLEVRSLQVPPPPPGFKGVEVRLEGLWVYKLRFSAGASARSFMARQARSVTTRLIMDQLEGELVVLAGPALKDSARAAKVLQAAWKGRSGEGRRGEFGVWAGKSGAFALLSRAAGELYEGGARLLRASRSGEPAAGFSFSDPGVRNHLLYQEQSRYGGVLLCPEGLLHVSAPTREAATRERRYLVTLLTAVGESAPSKSAKTLPLLEPNK